MLRATAILLYLKVALPNVADSVDRASRQIMLFPFAPNCAPFVNLLSQHHQNFVDPAFFVCSCVVIPPCSTYPAGGDSACVTRGVVSRIGTQQYAFGGSHLLAIQIDAGQS